MADDRLVWNDLDKVRIKQLTDGRSLATNIALVKHNAQVGTALAIAMQAVVAR